MSFLGAHREGLTTEDTKGTEKFWIRLYGRYFYLALEASSGVPVVLLIL
jgi:hypothetical protein